MKHLKLLLIGLGLLLGIGTLAYTQTVILQNPNGTDVVLVQKGSVGGTGYPTTIQALRNAFGHVLVNGGTTVNTSMTNAQAAAIAIGAITTWNVSLPNNPFTGEWVELTCPGGTVTTVNVLANGTPAGAVIVGTGYTACTSGGVGGNNAEYTYSTSANTWYRIN